MRSTYRRSLAPKRSHPRSEASIRLHITLDDAAPSPEPNISPSWHGSPSDSRPLHSFGNRFSGTRARRATRSLRRGSDRGSRAHWSPRWAGRPPSLPAASSATLRFANRRRTDRPPSADSAHPIAGPTAGRAPAAHSRTISRSTVGRYGPSPTSTSLNRIDPGQPCGRRPASPRTP